MKSRYIFVGIALLLIMSTLFLPSLAVKLNHVGTRIRTFASNLLHATEKQREIERLQAQIAGLAKQLFDQGYAQKQKSLQKAGNTFFLAQGTRIILSSVIGKGIFLDSQTLILDRGANAGVIQGEAVVAPQENANENGLILIGRIANVFSDRSYVLLLTDASFEISAKLISGQAKGKVKGGIGDRVTLEEITQGLALKEGDLIITDNDNPQIPSGIVIGNVEKVLSILTDTSQKAGVRIFFDPAQLDAVGVVKTMR